MFEEYRGYLIARDAFGYYEVWSKDGNWIERKIATKKQAMEIIDNIA